MNKSKRKSFERLYLCHLKNKVKTDLILWGTGLKKVGKNRHSKERLKGEKPRVR